jgi:hypothetical protein
VQKIPSILSTRNIISTSQSEDPPFVSKEKERGGKKESSHFPSRRNIGHKDSKCIREKEGVIRMVVGEYISIFEVLKYVKRMLVGIFSMENI